MRPPITWHGGKARLAPAIIAQFPPHRAYVELFGGSGAVLLAKPRSRIETYNDLDGGLVNLFRVLRNEDTFELLARALSFTPYSRVEFDLAAEPTDEPVERARRFIVRQRQSHGGHGDHWSFAIADSRSGVSSAAARWLAGIDALPAIHERLRGVQIECDDWCAVLRRYDDTSALIYADPPYVPETRVRGEYAHELTVDDHRELVEALLGAHSMVVLSGYAHEVYRPLEAAEWLRIDIDVPSHASVVRSRRVECLWLNPAAVAARATEQKRLFSN